MSNLKKKRLKVAIADFPPLIIDKGGIYVGYEIELWEAIAKNLGIVFEYEKHKFKDIIPLLTENKVDIGLSGITINESREEVIDYSHPTLDSGLLISLNKSKNKFSLLKTFRFIFDKGNKLVKTAALSISIFILFFGHLLWLVEKSSGTFAKNYIPGIFESFWFIIVTIATIDYGDYVPHTWLGRSITILVLIGGVTVFGILLAQITAFFAVEKMRGQITNIRDLSGKKVATVEGTTSIPVLTNADAKVIPVTTINEAFNKLGDREVDAVVFDAPAAVYFKNNDPEGRFETVGELFEKQKYAIALQQPSPWLEDINRAFLNLKESGKYNLIYRKWFGEDTRMEF